MGVWYTSSTIIGYRITPIMAKIRTETKVPSCSHNPPADSKFCPTCGTKVGNRTQTTWTDEWDEFEDDFLNQQHPNDIIAQRDFENPKRILWFGYGAQCDRDDDPKCTPIKPYDEIKAEIAALLKPWTDAGLFVLNDEDFGIWTLVIGH